MDVEMLKQNLPSLEKLDLMSDRELLDLYYKIDNFIEDLKERQTFLEKDEDNEG